MTIGQCPEARGGEATALMRMAGPSRRLDAVPKLSKRFQKIG